MFIKMNYFFFSVKELHKSVIGKFETESKLFFQRQHFGCWSCRYKINK